jgi:hypothetical protein
VQAGAAINPIAANFDRYRALFARRTGDATMAAKKLILILALLATAASVAFANPPGGAYIQCDPRNPRSPIRCTPDGW